MASSSWLVPILWSLSEADHRLLMLEVSIPCLPPYSFTKAVFSNERGGLLGVGLPKCELKFYFFMCFFYLSVHHFVYLVLMETDDSIGSPEPAVTDGCALAYAF